MIIDITAQNFQTELLEASQHKPLVLYFYAPQMPECQAMTPLVEALVGVANSQVTLAKVDMNDPNLQPLAGQLGLRALPALVKFYQGRPDDSAFLEGPQDEAALRAYFAAFGPKPEELLLAEGKAQLAAGEFAAALASINQALALDSTRMDSALYRAECLLGLNQLDEAQSQLAAIPMAAQDSHFQALQAQLALALQAADSPELRALEAQYAQVPSDGTIAQELALQYQHAGRQEEALALLLTLLRKDLNFGQAKKIYLDILATLGATPMAQTYRRKLYTLLY
ncbi:MAG: tetratricopeptide repeat protein [Aeromonas sp.]